MALYKPGSINQSISRYNNILQKQSALNKSLKSKNSEEKLNKVSKFYNKNKDSISAQLDAIVSLNLQIQKVISENMKMQEEDSELSNLLRSREYRNLDNKMRKTLESIDNFRIFLKKKKIF